MNTFLCSAKTHYFFRVLFLGMSLFMIYVAVQTSIESNLFQEWNSLAQIPWMRATLWDFYFNIAIISAWMIYKENHFGRSVLWLTLFIVLGSIATAFYVFLQLRRVSPGEAVTEAFSRRS